MKRSLVLFFALVIGLFIIGCGPQQPQLPNLKSYPQPEDPKVKNPWEEKQNIDVKPLQENLTETKTQISEVMSEDLVERIAFPNEEYKYLRNTGTASVKGKIFLSNTNGRPIASGANTRLYLNPVTSYSNQWYEESYVGGRKMEEPDPRFYDHLKSTSSDDKGNYAFYGIPSGSYYLSGAVECGRACGFNEVRSVRLVTKVTIGEVEIKEQNLTREIE